MLPFHIRCYMQSKFFVFIILTCVLLAGCMPKALPDPEVYTLGEEAGKDTVDAGQEYSPDAPVLKLAPVNGPAPFVSTDILYRNAHHGLDSYALSRWSGAPVKMVEIYLIEDLSRTGLFKAVLPPVSVSSADLLLECVLYDFSLHLDRDSVFEGVVRMRFYLMDSRTYKIVATKEFSSAVPAPDADAVHAVEAINRAVQHIDRELEIWLAREVALMQIKQKP